MLIRPAAPADSTAISAVLEAAFGRPDEARLVERLRVGDAYVPELELVAEIDGDVAGHVLFTYAALDHRRVLSLAPLAVSPERQNAGIGSALTRRGIADADARGEPLVIVLGHRDYYPRFGFEPAADYGIEPPVPEMAPSFMVVRLGSYDPSWRGRVAYPPAFDET